MPGKFFLRVFAFVFVLYVFSDPAQSITVDLDASQDNTLYEDPNGTLSNGAGPNFFAGTSGQERIHRGLLQFDVAGGIPEGATVTSATLTLYLSATFNDSISENIQLNRVQAAWGEGDSVAVGGGGGGGGGGPAAVGDATWTHRFNPTETWTTPGGDFSGIASSTTSVLATGFYSWGSTANMVGDVQDWLDDPNTNFGWMLRGNETFSFTSKRFDSRENSTVSQRPVLTIEYEGGSLSADFNDDTYVDGLDLGIWEAAYGLNDNGDTNGDNETGGADFINWQQQYTGPPLLQSVPEPAAAALLVIPVLLALGGRYRWSIGT